MNDTALLFIIVLLAGYAAGATIVGRRNYTPGVLMSPIEVPNQPGQGSARVVSSLLILLTVALVLLYWVSMYH